MNTITDKYLCRKTPDCSYTVEFKCAILIGDKKEKKTWKESKESKLFILE